MSRHVSWKFRPGDQPPLNQDTILPPACLQVTLTASVTGGKKLLGNIDRYNIRLSPHLWWAVHRVAITSRARIWSLLEFEAWANVLVRPFSHRSSIRGIMGRRMSSVWNFSLFSGGCWDSTEEKELRTGCPAAGGVWERPYRWVLTRSDRADGRERASTVCAETPVSKQRIQNTSGPGKQRGASTQAGRLAAGDDVGKTRGCRQGGEPRGPG